MLCEIVELNLISIFFINRAYSIVIKHLILYLVDCRGKFDYHNILQLWKNEGSRGRIPDNVQDVLLSSNISLSRIWRKGGYQLDVLLKQVNYPLY